MKHTWLVLTLPLLLNLPGCSSDTVDAPTPEDPVKELQKSSSKTVDTPQEIILKSAQRYFAAQLYSLAKDTFETLRDSYPQGPYAEYAQIKFADCAFELRDYPQAAQLYEDFTKDYPTSSSNAYALFRAARSLQLGVKSAERDSTPLEKAIDLYSSLQARYPQSVQARQAVGFKADALTTIANHEQFVADFYRKKEKDVAADAREKIALTYSTQAAAAKKELRPIPDPHASAPGEVPDAPTVLAAMRTSATSKPSQAKLSGAVAPDTLSHQFDDETKQLTLIRSIECGTTPLKVLLISVNETPELLQYVEDNPTIDAVDGSLQLKFPLGRATPERLSCFAESDVEVSENGEVTIRGAAQAELTTLSSPPRLLVTLR